MECVRLKASETACEHLALVDKVLSLGVLVKSSETQRRCPGIRQLSKGTADGGATVGVGGYRQTRGEARGIHVVLD